MTETIENLSIDTQLVLAHNIAQVEANDLAEAYGQAACTTERADLSYEQARFQAVADSLRLVITKLIPERVEDLIPRLKGAEEAEQGQKTWEKPL